MIWQFTIIHDSTETVIDEPGNWDSITKTIQRDPDWHGVFFNFSESNLKFIEEAYWIIKEEYLSKLTDGDVGLRVEYFFNGGYYPFYSGKLDFQRYNENCGDDCSIEVGLEASETEVLIKNRMDTAVDLASDKAYDGSTVLTDYDGLNKEIEIPGKAILIQSKAVNESQLVSANLRSSSEWHSNIAGSGDQMLASIIPGFNKILLTDLANTTFYNTIELLNGGANNRPSSGMAPAIDLKEFSKGLSCVSSAAAIKYRYKGVINSAGAAAPTPLFKIFRLPAGSLVTSFDYVQLASVSLGTAGTPFDISGVINTTLNVGDRIYVYIFLNIFNTSSYTSFIVTEDPECYFDVSLTSLCDPSPCKTYLIHEAGSRIVEHITNDAYKFKSEYYGRTDSEPYAFSDDGCGSLRALTNGLQIRRAVLQDNTTPKVFLSLKDYLESLNAIDCVGMGIEGNDVRVEPMKYFYSDDIIFIADGVEEINTVPRNDRVYNQFNFGYDKFETETTNGLDAIHTKRQYRSQLRNTDAKLEKFSKIIADGYATEVTRRKYGLSEDWRYDQNTFILCLKRDAGDLEVEQGAGTGAANMFDPATVLNFRISPIRNAMRWFKWAVQGIRGITQEFLFSSGDGNYVAKGELADGCVLEAAVMAENEALNASKFLDPDEAVPFIVPEKVTFKFPVGLNEFVDMAVQKYGKVQYRRLETEDWKYGWIDNLKYTPEEGLAEFTLITSAE